MKQNPNSQSGIFTPRVLVAFALCSCGVLLGMFSLAATPPVETTRANESPITNHQSPLPPGVPLPPGMASSPRDPLDAPRSKVELGNDPSLVTRHSSLLQDDPSSSSPTAGFPGFAGMPSGLDAPPGRKPGTASGANSLGNPVFANQQPAPLSVPQPAASESMPLASAAQSDWSIVNSPNPSPQHGRTTSSTA